MKRVLVKSVYDAFEYVMQHFYCFGQADMAERKDTYAVISIQDTHTQGFGFQFCENQFCKGVLTLYFDDIIREVDGAVLFTDEMADQIITFVLAHRSVETLLADNPVPEPWEPLLWKCWAAIPKGILKPVLPISMSTMCWKRRGSDGSWGRFETNFHENAGNFLKM
jgi:hypothetical protein